jgi:hypothetical protein
MLNSTAPLRVLIGCECSGVGRRAFAALGHDVWSCDLKPAEDRSNRHLQVDLLSILNGWEGQPWDLLAVLHPPCTRLCNSGVRWYSEPPTQLNDDYSAEEKSLFKSWSREQKLDFMWAELDKGVAFFQACWDSGIPRLAIENPVMHSHATSRLKGVPKASIVQPWWFGDKALKATGWYLNGLPPLMKTQALTPPTKHTDEFLQWQADLKLGLATEMQKPKGNIYTDEFKEWNWVHFCPRGPERSQIRSQSHPGMLKAAAMQWGGFALDQVVAA